MPESERTLLRRAQSATVRGVFVALLGACHGLGMTPATIREYLSRPLGAALHVGGALAIGRVKPEYQVAAAASEPLAGGQRRPIQELYRSSARLTLDMFWLMAASPRAIQALFHEADLTHLHRAREQSGNGAAILVFPHLGSYRAGAALLGQNNIPTTIVARYGSQTLNGLALEQFCKKSNVELVQLDPSRPSDGEVMTACEGALKRGHVVAVAGDVYVSRSGARKGVDVDMAGARRTIGAGPAVLTLRTGAPVVCAAIYHRGRHREVVMRPPIYSSATRGRSVQSVSERVANEMSTLIAQAPAQWYRLLDESRQRRSAAKADAKSVPRQIMEPHERTPAPDESSVDNQKIGHSDLTHVDTPAMPTDDRTASGLTRRDWDL